MLSPTKGRALLDRATAGRVSLARLSHGRAVTTADATTWADIGSPDQGPSPSFTSACDAGRGSRALAEFARVAPISSTSLLWSVSLELRSLPSAGVTRLRRYCGPFRHRCALLDRHRSPVRRHDRPRHRAPVLRALSLCVALATTPAPRLGCVRSIPPVVSAFPVRVDGSACASSFSRLARRSLAFRPAHSRCHRIS